MSLALPVLCLARHGETLWTISGQHTGLTDLALTGNGERQALALRPRLEGREFAKVLTSPLQRARRTCDLAGFGQIAEIDADLVEWDYGDFEGLRSVEIHAAHPEWQLFRDGCPGGESADDVAARADRVLDRVRKVQGNVLLFSSGHFLRMLAARWLGLPPEGGKLFVLATASISELTYERTLSQPVVQLWNDTRHTAT